MIYFLIKAKVNLPLAFVCKRSFYEGYFISNLLKAKQIKSLVGQENQEA